MMDRTMFQPLEEPVQAHENNDGIVAFQLVSFKIMVYGSAVEGDFDTKIMADGRQLVVSGNGFFEHDYNIN